MALFEQTKELLTAEERFHNVAHALQKTAKHEHYSSKKYGELTDNMRQWVVNLGDIATEFHIKRQSSENFGRKQLMHLEDFVRYVHWMLTHYDTEEDRLNMLLDVLTTLFYGTRENEKYGWYPFSKPLREIFDEAVERKVERRVREELKVRMWKEMQEGIKE